MKEPIETRDSEEEAEILKGDFEKIAENLGRKVQFEVRVIPLGKSARGRPVITWGVFLKDTAPAPAS